MTEKRYRTMNQMNSRKRMKPEPKSSPRRSCLRGLQAVSRHAPACRLFCVPVGTLHPKGIKTARWSACDEVRMRCTGMPVCQNRIECKQSTEARLRLHFKTNLRCGEAWHYSDTPSAVAASGEVSTSESKLHRPAVPCICSLFIDKRCEMFFSSHCTQAAWPRHIP